MKKLYTVIGAFFLFTGLLSAQYTITVNDVDFDPSTGTISRYLGDSVDIIIPASFNVKGGDVDVKVIGEKAFSNKSLTGVVLPEGLEQIGSHAFYKNFLTGIDIPTTVTFIGGGAFNDNSISSVNGEKSRGIVYGRNDDGSWDRTTIVSYGGIADVVDFIPEGVTVIGDYAFSSNSLAAVMIPGSVTTIGREAFAYNNLAVITIPDGVTTLGRDAFAYNSLTSVTIPASVVTIARGAFYSNSLTGVTFIPGSLTTIGDWAFDGNSITSVTIPAGVTTIGYAAFYGNALTDVTIPASVTTIGAWAFANNSLTSVTFEENSNIASIGGSAFLYNSLTGIVLPTNMNEGFNVYKDGNGDEYAAGETFTNFYTNYFVVLPAHVLTPEDVDFDPATGTIKDYHGKYLNIIIPEKLNVNGQDVGVTAVGDMAFAYNFITSVVIPTSVTAIGDFAFYNNSLTGVIIPGSVTTIGNAAFSTNKLTSVDINNGVTSIGAGAFEKNKITGVTLPESVTTIGQGAFYFNNLTGITLPDSLHYIGKSAFERNSLTGITIPASVTTIEKRAFYSNSLTSVTFEDDSYIVFIGRTAFAYNSGLTGIVLPKNRNEGFEVYEDGDGNTYEAGKTITDFVPDYYAVLPPHTLTLEEVDFDPATGTIRDYYGRYLNIIIPESFNVDGEDIRVSVIGDWAFYLNNLISVTIPGSVTTLGAGAFTANKLTSIEIPGSVTTIGADAFASNKLTSIEIPKSVTVIGDKAFYLNSLTTVVIPNGVTVIGEEAFSRNSLTAVKFEDNSSTVSLGIGAFDHNSGLTKIVLPSNANEGFAGYEDGQGNEYAAGDEITDFQTEYYVVFELPQQHILTADDVIFDEETGTIIRYTASYRNILIPQHFTINGRDVLIKQIAKYAFEGKDLLKAVLVDGYLNTIGVKAFAGNYRTLDTVSLPAYVMKEGCTFTQWENEQGDAVTDITDFSDMYKARFDTTGYVVSGSISGVDEVTVVEVRVSGDVTQTVYPDAEGHYSFLLTGGRNVTITPEKEDYVFYPSDITISNITEDMAGQDFTASPTGILPREELPAVRLYPNPVTDILTLEVPEGYTTLRLLDVAGTVVSETAITGRRVVMLNMVGRAPGVYVIQITGKTETFTGKVLKR